jgi:hypothetical protein
MISKSWSRKSIATAVAVAVLSVYSMVVLAAPGAKASGFDDQHRGSKQRIGEHQQGRTS